jgi:predicted Zn-dependent peptidase
MFKKTTLKNGLRIITVPQKNTQAVTVLVLVGTGSKYEKKETNGISHFVEHMFFKGTKKQPQAIDVAETLDRVGGIYNAFTGEENTGYFAKVASSHLDLALDWVSDIYFNSVMPEKEIEKEKGVIIQEINMYQDHPMSYVGILWSKLLYGDQPAGWPVAGTKETVSKISRENLMSYMKKQYVASNTVVCVSGNINSAKTTGKVKKYFSGIKSVIPFKKPQVFETQIKPECLLLEKETDQTHLCLGVRAYNIFHPQRYVQELLGIILGGMMSSRLFVEIREKMGLAYYISASGSADQDTGELVTQAGVQNQKLEKGIAAILKEYKKISKIRVPEGELKKAKDYLKGKMTLLLEASDTQASFYGSQELLEKKILTPKEIYKEIDKITQADVQKVARDIFQPRKLNLAVIGPFKDKKRFEKILKL